VLVRILIAILFAAIVLRMGIGLLRMLGTPQPEPPPPGELRKVRITYRCDICGTEVQMRVSPLQEPEPPRHCMDEMTMVTPIDDL
jgi:hypothetical protein